MKKLMLMISFTGVILLLLSCNNKPGSSTSSKEEPVKTVPAATPGLLGTYTTSEDNQPMQFILKADGKGAENYHGDMRPFTWADKNGKILFTYDGEAQQFELPIDRDKGEIHYGSLIYKKEK